MPIFAYTGRFGSGKSALACYMVWDQHKRFRRPMWSNFGLKESTPIYTTEDLYICRDGEILIDEIQGTADSRRSSSTDNRCYNEWHDQCRKQRSNVHEISQSLSKMDVRLRDMVDIEFHCRDLGNHYSEVEVWDLERDRLKNKFVFCRLWAAHLYDHEARAWPLAAIPLAAAGGQPAESKQASAPRKRSAA